MERTEGQTLREGFDRLAAGDPSGVPEDLEPALLNEALVGYADSAPLPVAEHLEPYVAAVTAGEDPDPTAGLQLLASAPVDEPVDDLVGEVGPSFVEDGPAVAPESLDLDFGAGTTELYVDDVAAELVAPGSATDLGGDDLGEDVPRYEEVGAPAPDTGGWLDLPDLSDRDDPDG